MAACSSGTAARITAPSDTRSRNSTAAAHDEVAGTAGLHFGRSDEAEKSIDHAILAAEKSQRRWANSEALAYFDDALRASKRSPTRSRTGYAASTRLSSRATANLPSDNTLSTSTR